jgi:hypothetical protein
MATPAIRDDARQEEAGRRGLAPAVTLRLVPDRGLRSGPEVTPVSDPRPLTRRIAQVIAEVLVGARAAAQLAAVATPEVVAQLTRSAGRLRAGPGVAQQRPIVGAVHLSEPRDGVAEACAVVNLGTRYRVIALRLEALTGSWRCTAVHVG